MPNKNSFVKQLLNINSKNLLFINCFANFVNDYVFMDVAVRKLTSQYMF